MKTKLIKLNEEHYIIVDNSEIKEGDFMYDIDGDIGIAIGKDKSQWEGNTKITHSTKPLEDIIVHNKYNVKGWGNIKPLSLSEVRELVKDKLFTKKDMFKVFKHGILFNQETVSNCKEAVETEFDLLIKSLQQPTEWDVEFINSKLTLKQ